MKLMKQLLILTLVFALMFSMISCSNNTETNSGDAGGNATNAGNEETVELTEEELMVKEAPMLAELVEKGELPALEKRLPIDADYILKKNYDVKIGIENRAMCHQIPDFYEAEYILSKLQDAPVHFWYDIGHGVMMENLGMFNNMDGLQKILSRTIGIHIHDVIGVNDHYAPYEFGDYIDMYLPFIIPVFTLKEDKGLTGSEAA